jgi:hypothetical protein
VLFPVFAWAVASGVPSNASDLAAVDTASTVADASGDASVPKVLSNVSGRCGLAYLVSPLPTIQRDQPTELAIILLPEQDGDPTNNGLFSKMVTVSARLVGKRTTVLARLRCGSTRLVATREAFQSLRAD